MKDYMETARSFSHLLKGQNPPFSLAPILNHFGIYEVRTRILYPELARIIFYGGHPIIEVNSLFSEENHRFSVGHELGHVILNEANGKDRFAISCDIKEEEEKADIIGRELVIPSWAVSFLTPRNGLQFQKASMSSHTLKNVARYFGVGAKVMRDRLVKDFGWYEIPNKK